MILSEEDQDQIRAAVLDPVTFRYTFFKRKKHPAQDKILRCDAHVVTVSAGRRFGKALDLNTPILTTEGWKTVGTLAAGDYVFDETGTPVKITALSEIYLNRTCYTVKFSDGSEIIADASHDWVTETKAYRATKQTTENIKNTLIITHSNGKIESNHAIPTCKTKQFNKINASRRFIVAVEPHQSIPVRCITVDNESHLFLAGTGLIPTHNSTGLSDSMLHYAMVNPESIQFLLAPTYDQTEITYSECVAQLDGSILIYMKENNHKTPFPQITFTNGSVINFRSTKNPENIRGHKAHRVILDEAAYISDSTVANVVEPMLADFDGDLWKISTPFGKNHFYKSWKLGMENNAMIEGRRNFASFTFTSLDNPHISKNYITRKAEEYGATSIIYRTEYLAQFVDDQNTVFPWDLIQSSIDETIQLRECAQQYHSYTIGVDIAKHVDFTVINVLDTTHPRNKQLVYYDRFNQRRYKTIIDNILDIQEAFGGADRTPIVVDSTGVGDPLYEAIEGFNAYGYVFTNKSKRALVERLQAALSPNLKSFLPVQDPSKVIEDPRETLMEYQLKIPYIQQLIKELQFYEYTINQSTQTIRFKGRDGVNDDSVMALALALWGCTNVEEGNLVALPEEAHWTFT